MNLSRARPSTSPISGQLPGKGATSGKSLESSSMALDGFLFGLGLHLESSAMALDELLPPRKSNPCYLRAVRVAPVGRSDPSCQLVVELPLDGGGSLQAIGSTDPHIRWPDGLRGWLAWHGRGSYFQANQFLPGKVGDSSPPDAQCLLSWEWRPFSFFWGKGSPVNSTEQTRVPIVLGI